MSAPTMDALWDWRAELVRPGGLEPGNPHTGAGPSPPLRAATSCCVRSA